MSGHEAANRVLSRLGARVLSSEEQERVAAGIITGRPCTIVDIKLCRFDGDCEPPIRCPL